MVNVNASYTRVVFQTYLIISFIYLFSVLTTFQNPLPDLPTRLDTNESFLNTYFLLWTNFWYLAPLYFFLILLLPRSSTYFWITALVYTYYLTELLDFTTLNLTWKATELTQFNTLLTNSLNKYHPFIFFVSTLFYYHYSTLIMFYSETHRYTVTNLLVKLKHSNNTVFTINLTALTLGGVWAFQEASWGGFWNWDSSETFGLTFLLISLYLTHVRTTLSSFYELINVITIYFKLIIILYCFIQLNFDLVSHNFGAKFFYFFSNSLFYEEVIFINLSVVLTLSIMWWRATTQLKLLTVGQTQYYKYINTTYVYSIVIWVLTYIVLMYSCSPLLTYFIFNMFHIHILNITFSLDNGVAFILLLLSFFFTTKHPRNSLLYLFLLNYTFNPTTTLIYNLVWHVRGFILLHNTLIAALIINILAYYMNFMIWFFKHSLFFSIVDQVLLTQDQFLITCDALFVNISASLVTTTTFSNWWNLLFQYNAISTNSFFLLVTNTGCFSLYQLTLGWVNSFIYISTPYVNLLLFSIILILLLYLAHYHRKLRIV